jgi:hypothetical protein
MVVNRIKPLSLGKILGVLYACIGVLIGLMFATLGSLFSAAAADQDTPGAGWIAGMGFAAVIIAPIMYGLIGFIGGIIMAALYNLFAKMVGGVELEMA